MLNILSQYRNEILDDSFSRNTALVFQNIDCLTCANCCKNYSPIIEPDEIPSLLEAIGVDSNSFFKDYIEMDEDGDFVFRTKPCPMLDLDTNQCTIYENRPRACREYPHTNIKEIKNHFDLLEKNIEICPAAHSIVEAVFKELNI